MDSGGVCVLANSWSGFDLYKAWIFALGDSATDLVCGHVEDLRESSGNIFCIAYDPRFGEDGLTFVAGS